MKILLITLHYEQIGGLEIYVQYVAEALNALGQDVYVWSVFESTGNATEEGIEITHLAPKGKILIRLYCRCLNLYLTQLILRKINRYEIVIALHPRIVPALYLASMLKPSMKYYVWTYGSDVWFSWPRFFRLGMEKAERLVAISSHTKESVVERLKKKKDVEIIQPPVDTESFKPDEDRQGDKEKGVYTLLTVTRLGKVDRYKGCDMVIKAIPEIERQLERRIEYRIVGSGEDIHYLLDLAGEEDVADKVKFTGRLDRYSLVKEYQNCDIFIMPSRMELDSVNYLTGEGFGIVYIEAAACGKPVIGSNQGGAAEAVLNGITGLTVNPESVEEIIEAVCFLLLNSDARRDMGQKGREYAETKYSLKVFKENLSMLLKIEE